MTSVVESKKEFLSVATGEHGSIPWMELLWLHNEGATAWNVNDAWRQYLDILGFTGGSVVEAKKAWLTDLGVWDGSMSGSLGEALKLGPLRPSSYLTPNTEMNIYN